MAKLPRKEAGTETLGVFQIAVLIMSCVALGVVALDTLVQLPPEISRLLQGIDFVICLAFLVDFLARFRAAESKREFMKWGWIDLIASIPSLDILRIGRVVRIVRVVRLLRGVQSMRRLFDTVFRTKAIGGLAAVSMLTLLLIIFFSIGILVCETAPNATIHTADDAVWWSLETVTTVGYGDLYPVTAMGRALAMVLMLSGVGLFGTLSGIIASIFLGEFSSPVDEDLLAEVRALRAELSQARLERSVAPLASEPPPGSVNSESASDRSA